MSKGMPKDVFFQMKFRNRIIEKVIAVRSRRVQIGERRLMMIEVF